MIDVRAAFEKEFKQKPKKDKPEPYGDRIKREVKEGKTKVCY